MLAYGRDSYLGSDFREFQTNRMPIDGSVSAMSPAARSSDRAHVAILLATKNGAAFLREQLDSYLQQSHTDWSLHVSDDGSEDNTIEIVQDFASRAQNPTTLREGPRAGCHKNFFSLLRDSSVDADYFAFSDQDDVWYPEKLERALSVLRRARNDQPALYCSRTELVDREGRHRGFSTDFRRTPSFRNALVENIAGGNTIVFNRAARELLKNVADATVVIHDWSIYVIISAVGGRILYDRAPSVRYRQHEGNLIGASTSFRTRVRRISRGKLQEWTTIHLKALDELLPSITMENRKVLESFAQMRRTDDFLKRCWLLWKSGVYRQTLVGQIGLLFATMLKKV